MQISIIRKPSEKGCTLSTWYLDGRYQCVGLEDVVRGQGQPKVPGQTAIPVGTYGVIINRSNRFSATAKKDVFLPLLLAVPGFEGVRIHSGNFARDTEGCLLPGTAYGADGASVINSRVAFAALFEKMQQAVRDGETIKLTIK
jgi:hypothetical protein